MRRIVNAVGVSLFAACVAACGGAGTGVGTRRDAPVVAVTASALRADYEANELAADGRYGGRRVLVSGVVESVGRDAFGSPHVVLAVRGRLLGVQCVFGRDADADLAKLARGEDVTVLGECAGLAAGVVIVSGCRLQ